MNLDEKQLTTKARKALPKGQFVFPKDRRYPIHDKAHARNALARVSQHGTPAEKAKVRAAVHRKFPKIGQKKVQDSVARLLGRPLLECQDPTCSRTCQGCGLRFDGTLVCPRCHQPANKALAEQVVVVMLAPPEKGTCTQCGCENEELRPYGPEGALICFQCGQKDEQGTSQRFLDMIQGAVNQVKVDRAAAEAAADAQGYGFMRQPPILG